MQQNRRTILSLIAGTGLAGLVPARRALSADLLPIKIGVSTSSEFVVIYYGIEAGVFAKHGLDAKAVSYPSGVEMVNGLLSGAQDVNTMGSLPFLSGLSRGFPLMLIGHLHGDPLATSYAPNQAIVAGPKLQAKAGDIRALAGKTIGLPRGASAEGYLHGIATQSGLGASDYKMVNLAPPNMIAALRGGDVDAVAVWEPWATGAVRAVEGATRLSLGGCSSCYDPGTVLTTKRLIATKADHMRRLMLAMAECQHWVRQNKAGGAVEVAMRWIPGLTAEDWRVGIGIVDYDQRMSKNTIDGYTKNTVPDLKAMGVLRADVDVTAAVDATFTDNAQQEGAAFFSDLAPIPAALRI